MDNEREADSLDRCPPGSRDDSRLLTHDVAARGHRGGSRWLYGHLAFGTSCPAAESDCSFDISKKEWAARPLFVARR